MESWEVLEGGGLAFIFPKLSIIGRAFFIKHQLRGIKTPDRGSISASRFRSCECHHHHRYLPPHPNLAIAGITITCLTK